jgi:hypothetical protein
VTLEVGPAVEKGREGAAVGRQEWPGIPASFRRGPKDRLCVVAALGRKEPELEAVEIQRFAVLEVQLEALAEPTDPPLGDQE